MDHESTNTQMIKFVKNFLTSQQHQDLHEPITRNPKLKILNQTLSHQPKKSKQNQQPSINISSNNKAKSLFLKMIRIKQQPKDKLILRNLKVQVIRKIYHSQNKPNHFQTLKEETILPIHKVEKKRLSILQQIKNDAKKIIPLDGMNKISINQIRKINETQLTQKKRKLTIETTDNKQRKSQSDFFPTIYIESRKNRQSGFHSRMKDRKNVENKKFRLLEIGAIQPWNTQPAKQQVSQLQSQQFFHQFYLKPQQNCQI